jgi:hypothetical protein
MNQINKDKRISSMVGAAIVLALLAFSPLAGADALHGFCADTTCTDNGTNTPTGDTTPDFGFWDASGPKTGDLILELLLPNNLVSSPSLLSFSVTGTGTWAGTYSGTATLFNSAAWTSGKLDTYLGFNDSPNNPIGAYLPSTQALDPGATGFFAYQVIFNDVTLNGSPTGTPTFTIDNALPWGSYILGYLNPPGTATANSAALFITNTPVSPVPEPETYAMLLAGLGFIGFIARRRKGQDNRMNFA